MVAVLAVAAALVPLSIRARTVVTGSPAPSTAPSLDRLPLAFETNLGQFGPAVRFSARAPGHDVALTGTGLVLSPAGISLNLEGAAVEPVLEGRDPLPGRVSRLIGDDPSRWASSAATYGSVAYRDVYPGIDMVVRGRGRQVEQDYVVAPGKDPRSITFAVSGADARIDVHGALRAGDVTLRPPELYQDGGGGRVAVAGAFEARGGSTFGFTVGRYDPALPLIIDPVIVSSSYLGGSSTDTAYAVATDADGNMVLTGYTESTDFPTLNPAQAGPAPGEGARTDVFVAKVRADGSSLLWSTYIGGRGRDAGLAVAVGPDGSTFVTGYTESNDFPTVRPIKGSNAGGSDVFVVKLNPAGNGVDFATYIGGGGTDTGNGIAVDQAGGVYVAGTTGSSNFPTAKAFQGSLSRPDDQDAFVLKIESSLTSLAWSSYLGGTGDDHATDVAVDRDGNVYVTGDTKSTNFPTSRPFQASLGGSGTGVGDGSFADAFVAKIKPDGSGYVFASFLGGADSDKGSGIAVDGEGNVYVAGNTGSANFPVVNAAQPKKDGDFDAFVAKVKADGSGLAYSTYIGGSGSDSAEGVAVDDAGRAFVVGTTASTNFPTEKPFQSAKGGGFVDAFVTAVAPAGNAFVSSSYLGGRDDDQAAGVALDRSGNIAVVGYTNSADFPIAKPFQPGRGGGVGDAFVAKVREDAAATSAGGAAVSERDKRVRLLITVTGLLFLAAAMQTFWLRRRPARPPQPAVRGPQPDRDRPGALPGVAYTPRQTVPRGEAGQEEPAKMPAGWASFSEQVAAARPRTATPPPPAARGSAPGRPSGPGLRRERKLRPLEPTPAAPPPERITAPDLWEPAGAEPEQVEVSGDATLPAAAGRDLAPEDVWGPLSAEQDPDEWAEAWAIGKDRPGDEAAGVAAVAPVEPEPVAGSRAGPSVPDPASEPGGTARAKTQAPVVAVEPGPVKAQAPRPVRTQASRAAPAPAEPAPSAAEAPAGPPPSGDLAEPKAQGWDAAVFQPPASPRDPSGWDPAPTGAERDPFAPPPLSQSEPSPAPGDRPLDQRVPVGEGWSPPPPAVPVDEEWRPPTGPEPGAELAREPEGAPEEPPVDESPPPERLGHGLFEPDPDDPLVKATRRRSRNR